MKVNKKCWLYTEEQKESLIKKYLSNPEIGYTEFGRRESVPATTLRGWLNKMGKGKSNSALSAEQKFKLLMKYSALTKEQQGKFLREYGIYSHTLEQWRGECIQAWVAKTDAPIKANEESKTLKTKVKSLEKELRRKDKA
jgi:transposase-like protein